MLAAYIFFKPRLQDADWLSVNSLQSKYHSSNHWHQTLDPRTNFEKRSGNQGLRTRLAMSTSHRPRALQLTWCLTASEAGWTASPAKVVQEEAAEGAGRWSRRSQHSCRPPGRDPGSLYGTHMMHRFKQWMRSRDRVTITHVGPFSQSCHGRVNTDVAPNFSIE